MKYSFEKIRSFFIENDSVWFFMKPIFQVVIRLEKLGSTKSLDILTDDKFFPTLQVQNGPFKGMVYPYRESIGSTLVPKLIGSYENELTSLLSHLCSINYSEIVDIGCAEGYYAIGLAKRIPEAKIYAYDTDESARELCYKMAVLNNVTDQIIIDAECSHLTLRNFKFSHRSLIICDCEGYEKYLFNEDNVHNLKNSDLLIEMHDFIDSSISTNLRMLFKDSHDISIFKTIDDVKKAVLYKFQNFDTLSLYQKRRIFAEGRPGAMEWIFCKPKGISV